MVVVSPFASFATNFERGPEGDGLISLFLAPKCEDEERVLSLFPGPESECVPKGGAAPAEECEPKGGSAPESEYEPKGGAAPESEYEPKGGAAPESEYEPKGGAAPAEEPTNTTNKRRRHEPPHRHFFSRGGHVFRHDSSSDDDEEDEEDVDMHAICSDALRSIENIASSVNSYIIMSMAFNTVLVIGGIVGALVLSGYKN
jgi:hypothetical protein